MGNTGILGDSTTGNCSSLLCFDYQ